MTASLFFAPQFNRINGRIAASGGFGVAALAFLFASTQEAFAPLAAAHVVAGFSAGTALSFTHGTIGRSVNPHRLFAIVGTALGVFSIIFLGVTPNVIEAFGGPALFRVFAVVTLVAAIVAMFMFPKLDKREANFEKALPQKVGRAVWAGILGVSTMALIQAMVFSFLQQIGTDRDFGIQAITGVLIALGFINLFPAPLAALLENRLNANKVVLVGPLLQAAIALVITHSTGFIPYAAGGVVFVAVMIFTHTFAFGLLSRLEGTGRALAATPAMLMVGSAIGPILGGTLVKNFGYPAIGIAACLFAVIAVGLFSQARVRKTALLESA